MFSLEDNIKMYFRLVGCDSVTIYTWLRIIKAASYIE